MNSHNSSEQNSGHVTNLYGRKALATMGRRAGQQAAKRWHDPAHKGYQEAARNL